MPDPKPTDFWHDRALKLLCWRGHVRARGSTLWRYRWPKASDFLCTKTPLFWESWATKNIAKKPRKYSLRRATNVTFSKICGCRSKKEKVAPRGFSKLHFTQFQLSRGQQFWEVVFITAPCLSSVMSLNIGSALVKIMLPSGFHSNFHLQWSAPSFTRFAFSISRVKGLFKLFDDPHCARCHFEFVAELPI